MKDPQKEFGLVRMGGTIGWVLAAWPFTFILVDWDKVHAANPHGLMDWLGAVLGSGLTGEKLKAATAWTYRRGRASRRSRWRRSALCCRTRRRRKSGEARKSSRGWRR